MHNSSNIIDLSALISSFVGVLENLGYSSDLHSASNMQIAVGKLPPNLHEQWLNHVQKSHCPPNLILFRDWIQSKAYVHEQLLSSKPSDVDKTISKRVSTNAVTVESKKSVPPSGQSNQCPFCKSNEHPIWKCSKFKSKTPSQRRNFVRDKHLCFLCLGNDHDAAKCTRIKKCSIPGCEYKHNMLIHVEPKGPNNQGSSGSKAPARNNSSGNPLGAGVSGTTGCCVSQVKKGVLQVLEIGLKSASSTVRTWALCDGGSTHSWISDKLREELQVLGASEQMFVHAFNGTLDGETTRVNLELLSTEDDSFVPVSFSPLVRRYLTLGDEIIDLSELKKSLPHLSVVKADELHYRKIAVVLGQDVFSAICPEAYQKSEKHFPWAVKLPIGWVISGPLPNCQRLSTIVSVNCNDTSSVCGFCSAEDLSQQVSQWWSIESFGSFRSVKPRSQEDKDAIKILESTCKFTGERYQVGLIWNPDRPPLPNNYITAKKYFLSLEKRLDKDLDLKKRYSESIQKDIASGYVRELSPAEIMETESYRQWYLAHHPVQNPNKPGKLRRVCNAASKYMRTSLNDSLLAGPDLLHNLVEMLIRFRHNEFALSADIEAMFMRVEVLPSDQRFLRFLWREGPNEIIRVFQYNRHIFGARSSPTCANYCLQQTAKDNIDKFPHLLPVVLASFDMDDLLKSSKTADEAISLAKDLVSLLKSGGFNRVKFETNSSVVFDSISKAGVHTAEDKFENQTPSHVLGLRWQPLKDVLSVSRGVDTPRKKSTQREILSAVSAVFDPLGFISPFTIRSRFLLKDIWRLVGQSWDCQVPSDIENTFKEWLGERERIKEIEVPRHFFPGLTNIQIYELHVFADASQLAMCVVIYLRCVTESKNAVSFVLGKTRVAPMKDLTVPKLKLQAALIACRLHATVKRACEYPLSKSFFWSDSCIVLQWIRSSQKKQPVFVANRVAEILDTCTVDQWYYVPTDMNPADIGTRGISIEGLISSIWFPGPPFLRESIDSWPMQPSFVQSEEAISAAVSVQPPLIDWDRFSRYDKLRRVVAYLLRVKNRNKGALSPEELLEAENKIWSLVQRECFNDTFNALHKERDIPDSDLKPLSPFLQGNLLRAKGRLRKASCLTFEQKHPLILHSKHHVVKIFLQHLHLVNHHEGVEYIRSVVQQKYWIIKCDLHFDTLRYVASHVENCPRKH